MAESDQSWIPIKFETAHYLHPKYKCKKKTTPKNNDYSVHAKIIV